MPQKSIYRLKSFLHVYALKQCDGHFSRPSRHLTRPPRFPSHSSNLSSALHFLLPSPMLSAFFEGTPTSASSGPSLRVHFYVQKAFVERWRVLNLFNMVLYIYCTLQKCISFVYVCSAEIYLFIFSRNMFRDIYLQLCTGEGEKCRYIHAAR